MRYFCCFLLALWVGLAGTADAQDITVFGGFQHPGAIRLTPAIESISGSAGQVLNDAKDFGVFGVRLYRSNASLGLEHTVAFSPNFVNSDARAFIYNTNLRVELPAPLIRPYVTAGAGLLYAGGDGPAAFGSNFTYNYGGGLRVSLLGTAGVRIDVRGYSIRGVEDQTLKVLESSIGIFFSF